MNFIGGFIVGGLIVVGSLFGGIAYFLASLGPVFVDLFAFLCIGLFFVVMGVRVGSPWLSFLSSCITIFLVILAIAAGCYGFKYAGWPVFGRGGVLLLGVGAGFTYAARRSNIWLWRFFSALSEC
ncbi:hypothetical protein [Desulfovibrio sp. TomC]|uniref:hypothetical protein n=1 Tax=Desulfovibrio sp. TomC TaxID=1562888 RepID=UPI0012E18A03|nr:hypothetical protein [Desulfovibrio sp. TomC]